MSRNDTADPGADVAGRAPGEARGTGAGGDGAVPSPIPGEAVLEALADRLGERESVHGPLGEAGVTVEEVIDPLSRVFDEGEESATEAGRRLGDRLAASDVDERVVVATISELSDLVVGRIVEEATAGSTADGGTGSSVGGLDERIAAANRRLLAVQSAAGNALRRADESASADRVETLETERDELEEQLERQRRIAKQVAAAVDTTGDLNRTVSDLAGQIDRRTENQAADVETVGREASKLSATVEEVASMAEGASQTSSEAVELAQDGQRSGSEALERMEEVDRAARAVTEDVDGLQSQIGEIDAFVEVINEVADQTNLLALNASIEAARAGEAGSGFSVVADEIKVLAETSRAEATKVETMVEEIQSDAAETRESLSETTTRLQSGTEAVESAMERMEEIVERIQQTAEAIDEVSDASDEQAVSAEEIAGMIDDLDRKAWAISEDASEISEGMEAQLENVELIASSVDRIAD